MMTRNRRWMGGLSTTAFLMLSAGCGGDRELDQPVPMYGNVPIEYPLEMWDEGVEGETVVRVRVNETGGVDSVEVVESSGHPQLDSAAVAGARELRFQPGRREGQRVEVWATVPVQFSRRPESPN